MTRSAIESSPQGHFLPVPQTVLDLAEDKGLEGKEGLLDKLLEFGYYVDISVSFTMLWEPN